MAEKTTILIPCSKEFKDALGVYAAKHNTDVSKVLRQAAATLIGYDLTQDIAQLGRRRKYATDEERKEARREKVRDERILLAAIKEAVLHDEHVRNVLAVQTSLERKGVDIDD